MSEVLQDVTLSIGGADRTVDVVPRSLQWQDVLGHRLDRLSFDLRGAVPDLWAPVRLTVTGEVVFTGYVLQATRDDRLDAPTRCEAVDEGILLDRKVVTAAYEGMYDGEIIKDLVAEAGLALDVSGVQNVKWITRVRFNRRTLRDAIQRLADLAGGAAWYVHDGALYYWNGDGVSAPFGFSETPDGVSMFAAEAVQKHDDATGVVNMVEVVGATYLSEPTTMYLQGTGEDTRLNLYFRVRPAPGESAVQVWRNDGDDAAPSWTPLAVKAGYIDTLDGADEVLYYYEEKALEALNPWPNLKKAAKVYGVYEIPLRVRVRSDASIAHYGLVLQKAVIDTSLASKEEARLAGKRVLAEQAFAKTALTVKTTRPGLRSGQVLMVSYPSVGVDGEYLIHQVTMEVGPRGAARFTVQAGVYDPDLVDLLLALARDDEPAWSDEEVLDELLESTEAAGLAETQVVSADSAPYVFDAARWDFARFS